MLISYAMFLLPVVVAAPSGSSGAARAVTQARTRTSGNHDVRVPKRRKRGRRTKKKTSSSNVPKRVRRARGPSQVEKARDPACGARLPDAAPAPASGKDAAVLNVWYQWPNGSKLRVGFVDGSQEVRRRVAKVARRWTKHANLDFEFFFGAAPADADILVRFDDPKCDSALGTSSAYLIGSGMPSMNLCNIDSFSTEESFANIVLHEFGHALGLEHEHQSPKAKFEWNKRNVYDYYSMFGWGRSDVEMWIFRQLESGQVDASQYDPNSVMHYFFPASFTKTGVVFHEAPVLSAVDKREIARMYPGQSKNKGKKAGKRPRTFFQRHLIVRNETSQRLEVSVSWESRKTKSAPWRWSEGKAMKATVAPGAALDLGHDVRGRQARIRASAKDGSKWNEHAEGVRLAPNEGYRAKGMQTFEVELTGPPTTAPKQTADQLYAAGADALEQRKYKAARKAFRSFAKRYSTDDRVPWARFNTVVALYESGRLDHAIQSAYELISDLPDDEASAHAWFYGGAAAYKLKRCREARAYFEYVRSPDAGLSKTWREAADQYLTAIKDQRDACLTY